MLKKTCKSLSIALLVLILLSFFVKDGRSCRLYGVIADNLPDGMLEAHLITDPNSLSVLSSVHRDGWGFSYYPDYSTTPTLERGAIRAWNDPDYTTVVNQINSTEPKITLAHIRACTSGCCDEGGDSIANPHPFYRTKNGKTWTFIHNGGAANWVDHLDETYLTENAPYGSEVSECITYDPYSNLVIGSEYLFLLVLKKIEENEWNITNGVVEAANIIHQMGDSIGANFILSEGTKIWVVRKARTDFPTWESYYSLYYTYDDVEGYTAIASDYPPSTQGNWNLLENYHLAVISSNEAPTIIEFTTYDGIPDSEDNCPAIPNGPLRGTCISGTIGVTCRVDGDCGTGGFCSMNQEDTYPLQGNGIGDACDCEGNFDCDPDCDGSDAATFKIDFGRSTYNNLCESVDTCNGDFDCDGDCDGTDAALFKQDFGRSQFNNPCPACELGDWCVYE